MHYLRFPPWGFRDLVGDYLLRPFETGAGRLSPLTAVLTIAGVSLALWSVIFFLVMRWI